MLLTYDPYFDADRLAAAFLGAPMPAARVPIDALRRGEHVELRCDLPGVDRDSIEVSLDGRVLTVRAERRGPEHDGDEALELECAQGIVARDVLLGEHLDPAQLERDYRDGVLILRLPVVHRAEAEHTG